MKIALTIDSFVEGQGGVSTAVAALARNLRKHGHEVMVYAAADPSHENSDLDVVGLRALRYERFPGGRVPMAPIALVQELADFGPDVIHNHSMGTMGLQALAAAHLLCIPILATCHVFLAGFLKYAPISLEGLPLTKDVAWRYTTAFFNRFLQVTTPSTAMQCELVAHGLYAPVTAISNGVDTELFCPAQETITEDLRPLTLLHVGRLGYEKRVDIVLRAFARLVGDYPKARLLVVGDGPETKALQTLADDLRVSNQVHFSGSIPHHHLPDIYRLADLFITASTIETQGLVVLEAMASGLPIVGVNALALPELIQHSVNGYLVLPGDDHALAEAVRQLLQSPATQSAMGYESRRLAMQHSLPEVTRDYERLYQQVLAQAPRPILSMIRGKFDPALARSSFWNEGQALKDAGVEQIWEISKALQHRADDTFGPVVELARNGLQGYKKHFRSPSESEKH